MIKSKHILNVAIILSVLLIQLSTAVRVLADDGPPAEQTPVVTPTDEPAAEATPETTEAAPTEELTPSEPAAEPTEEVTPEPTETPAPEETAAADLEETAAPNPEETAAPDPQETATPDPEEAAAPETCAPATDGGGTAPAESGDASLPPCAGTVAEDLTVPVSDPMWCPAGHGPGETPDVCTPSFNSVKDLVDYLHDHPEFSGPGTVYLEAGPYDNESTGESVITIDYNVVPQLGNLSVLGGWDFGTNTRTGTTDFDVPVEVVNWNGDVTLSNITVTLPSTSPETGVFVGATGDVTLADDSSTGGYSGAEVVAGGGVGVVGGDYSGNDNYGLLIYSGGVVSLSGVTASNNNTGIYIDNTAGISEVHVGNIFADDNGWTGVDIRSAGHIDFEDSQANGNIVGANLDTTAGSGNIFVSNSTFTGNDSVGLKAVTGEGGITLTDVTADGQNLAGSYGAWLKSLSGGTITVTGGSFVNADTGLFVVGTGDVALDGITADGNAGQGAMVQSGWVFGCFGPDGINVNVNGGVFHDNGGYGFVIYPGPNGNGTLSGTFDFSNNGAGNYNIDLTKSCVRSPEEPGLPYQVVEVSGRGDDPVPPDCEHYSGVMMILPDGTRVKVACPVTDPLTVTTLTEEDLPGALPNSVTLIEGLVVVSGEDAGLLPDGSSVKLCFKIPEGIESKHFAILFWDVLANSGLGGWVELPANQFGGQVFPLHPDTPEDGMRILEGTYRVGDCVCARVNFTGTFVLVAR
jgi:hypothetical protein